MNFLKKICFAAMSSLAALLPANADTERAAGSPDNAALALAIVGDFSQGDPKAMEIARAALAGESTETRFDDLMEDYPVFTTVAASLERTGRMISLDWAEGVEESASAFADLFRAVGLDPNAPLALIDFDQKTERGGAVGVVYVIFRSAADAAGWRIVGVNANSDTYHFSLVPVEIAEKWQSVRIGENKEYIEDSDWQFLSQLKAAGMTPRSTAHPSKSDRPAPL